MAAYLDKVVSPHTHTEEQPDAPPAGPQDSGLRMTIEQREMYVGNMDLRDYQAYQDALRDHDTGLKPALQVACGRCTAENNVPVVLGANFFRPPRRS